MRVKFPMSAATNGLKVILFVLELYDSKPILSVMISVTALFSPTGSSKAGNE